MPKGNKYGGTKRRERKIALQVMEITRHQGQAKMEEQNQMANNKGRWWKSLSTKNK